MNASREQKLRQVIRQTQPDLTVVLENIFDPLNISAVLRSCDAVGVREVFVVYTKTYLDKRGLVLGKRTSGGTFKWTDVYVFEDLDECMRRVRERYQRVLATLPGEASQSLFALDLTQPAALLFGNEDEGISPEALALCDGFFTIPQAGFSESLNISVACAVTLYEAYRQRAAQGAYADQPKLTAGQQEQLFERWSKMLKDKEYRNRGVAVGPESEPLLPIYTERISDTPREHKVIHQPLTKFDL